MGRQHSRQKLCQHSALSRAAAICVVVCAAVACLVLYVLFGRGFGSGFGARELAPGQPALTSTVQTTERAAALEVDSAGLRAARGATDALAPRDANASAALRGRLVDERGLALPGLRMSGCVQVTGTYVEPGIPRREDIAVESDAAGVFRMPLPASASLVLWLQGQSHVLVAHTCRFDGDQHGVDAGDLLCREAGTFVGRIVDENAVGIEGAACCAFVGSEWQDVVVATTEADGRFVLRGLASPPLRFIAKADGFEPLRVDAGATPLPPLLRLRRAPSCRIHLIDESGQIVETARVRYQNLPAVLRRDLPAEAPGVFVVDVAADDSTRLTVEARGFVMLHVNLYYGVKLLNVSLVRQASLAGRVTNAEGEPLADVPVSFETGNCQIELGGGATLMDPWRTTVRSDGQGHFACEGVPAGQVEVQCGPRLPHRVAGAPSVSSVVVEARFAPPAAPIRLVAPEPVSFDLRVLDEAGRSVNAARVGGRTPFEQAVLLGGAETDASGRATLRAWFDTECSVEVVKPGFVTAQVRIGGAQSRSQKCVLRRGARATVRVFDTERRVAPNVSIAAVLREGSAAAVERYATTDGRGNAPFVDMEPGVWTFRTMASSSGARALSVLSSDSLREDVRSAVHATLSVDREAIVTLGIAAQKPASRAGR